MRNTIQYYYGIEVTDIIYENHKYYFDDYILTTIYNEINMDIYNYMNRLRLNNYEIVVNRDGKPVTVIDDKKYVLLKKINNITELNFSNLERISILIKRGQMIFWDVLWEQKVDYYEKHAKTLFSNKLKNSIHYYVGLTENAISLYKQLKREENVYLSHIRLFNDDDYLNPINYIVDYRARDVAEYVKRLVFNGKMNIDVLMLYLINNNFNNYEYALIFIRLLYPSYYFDTYDLIAQGEDDGILDKYLNQIELYESFLREVYNLFRKYVVIPRIEWLINKKELSFDNSKIHPYL